MGSRQSCRRTRTTVLPDVAHGLLRWPAGVHDAAIDASSLGFVQEFATYIADRGYAVANVDSFIALGTIRLRPHTEAMRENLAKVLGMDVADVSVKA